MNAKLKNIPWFIEGSDCAMLRVSPDDFVPANRPTVYVRLNDVVAILPIWLTEEESNAKK